MSAVTHRVRTQDENRASSSSSGKHRSGDAFKAHRRTALGNLTKNEMPLLKDVTAIKCTKSIKSNVAVNSTRTNTFPSPQLETAAPEKDTEEEYPPIEYMPKGPGSYHEKGRELQMLVLSPASANAPSHLLASEMEFHNWLKKGLSPADIAASPEKQTEKDWLPSVSIGERPPCELGLLEGLLDPDDIFDFEDIDI